MTYDEFINEVAERAGVDRAKAEEYTRETLLTLGERITRGEADDVASQLPKELKALLITDPPEAEPFDLDEFLRRIADRSGATDREEAERAARAVLTTLRHATTAGEFEDMLAQLPDEFTRLVDLSVTPAGP